MEVRTVFRFLQPYRRSMTAAIILMLVELVVELWHPLLLARMIDEGIVPHDFGQVLKWGGLMIGLALLGFISGIINTFYAADASQGFAHDIRQAMFTRLQTVSYAAFGRFPASTLITRLTSDVTQTQLAVFLGLRVFLRSPLVMIGALVLAVSVNAKLALLLLVVTPLLIVLLGIAMKWGFLLFRAVQERLDRMNGTLLENLKGIRLIRAFVRGEHEKDRFAEANSDLAARTTAALRLSETMIPCVLLVMNLSVLVLLWVGSAEIGRGTVNVGEVVAVVNYATRITGAFGIISMMITSLSRARAAVTRMEEVLRTEERPEAIPDNGADQGPREGREPGSADAREPVTAGAVEFDGVTFRYPGTAAPVLESLTFRVGAGQLAVILGATGSGKTSLLQLVPRLYEAEGGAIRIDGEDVHRYDPESLRGSIGYVPQEALLFGGSVRENLVWGREDASLEEMEEAARRAQIHQTIADMPEGYDTVIGQKGSTLSGGQKQRLSIARALLRRPKLLLLDDCTSALDARTEARLLGELRAMSCTILLVTQKITAAQQADTILLLEDGKLLAQGSHEELLENSDLYRSIVQSQAREERVGHA
ncbi:ABC transporter ATP-binding protein [Paenibacillus caseinilyticus]|uniref:ABC transporter n=1 Tax=Paenibacillus mucilaginosus K02 TaxID=997761 RepID=I0BTF8_9BACL|nr:ABC transporter ATP-binding protein [Paenibacillus mucilaginosus]AFH65655.1 ABC transporter [Paenibacillus mucilaginosus K02]